MIAEPNAIQVAALIEQAYMLVERLERISVDSIWARRSSGHRGALLRWTERFNQPGGRDNLTSQEINQLQTLVAGGFKFLERAAAEKAR